MAVSFNNVITKNYSGRIGDVVLRRYGDKSVLSKRPDCSKVIKSERQLANMVRFQKAVRFSKYVIQDQLLSEFYREKGKKLGLNAYNTAMSDYLSHPVIEQIEVGEYKGLPGDMITASVWGKWEVEGVSIVICDTMGNIIECGAAVPKQYTAKSEWEYTATVLNVNYIGCQVQVQVKTKPGKVVTDSVILDGS